MTKDLPYNRSYILIKQSLVFHSVSEFAVGRLFSAISRCVYEHSADNIERSDADKECEQTICYTPILPDVGPQDLLTNWSACIGCAITETTPEEGEHGSRDGIEHFVAPHISC